MASFEDGAATNENVSGPYDEMIRVLAEIPRPRPVRMSRRGKMNAMVITIALLASLGVFAAGLATASRAAGPNAGTPNSLSSALLIAIVVVVVVVMLRTIKRQKFLLAQGEMATAHVTKRWIAHNGQNIHYEFSTPLGEHLSGTAADASRQLSVGMNVPIFYDPQRPKKQLALCALIFEVVIPGKG